MHSSNLPGAMKGGTENHSLDEQQERVISMRHLKHYEGEKK